MFLTDISGVDKDCNNSQFLSTRISPGDISNAISHGLLSLETKLESVSGDKRAKPGTMSWEEYYRLKFKSYGLEPLVLFGQYIWRTRQYIVFMSALHGLLQYECGGGYASVLSKKVDLEEIIVNLGTRGERLLDTGELVSEVHGRLNSKEYMKSLPEPLTFDFLGPGHSEEPVESLEFC